MSTATDEFPRLTHGNYHAWAPRMTAELQRLGVWRFCMGDESIPAAKSTATSPPGNATIAEKAALERNFADATSYCQGFQNPQGSGVGSVGVRVGVGISNP